jgi:hypothetical protein
MPRFPREELEEMVRRFVAANDEAGRTGDWSPLGDFYTEDALYTWNYGPKYEIVARGREEIRRCVFGTEMEGLERWVYPYVRVLIDDRLGEVIGIWRQVAPVKDREGKPYEIAGTGGSWFRYAGGYRWSWQRDFFDHANAAAVFSEMAKHSQLSAGMQRRLQAGSRMPGWVRRDAFDWYATLLPAEPE